MNRAMSFDEVAAAYHRCRPRYCTALFERIADYAGLGPGRLAVEVGCGTGQATGPILETGCRVLAVEPGGNLAAFAQALYGGSGRLEIHSSRFEDFAGETGAADLVYSATAFHWIPQEEGYPRAWKLLRPGGALALFWNRPGAGREGEPLFGEIQRVYDRYRSHRGPRWKPETQEARCDRILGTIARYGFAGGECRLYHGERRLSAEDYVALLGTYSDHRAMQRDAREGFERDMAAAVARHGGVVTLYDAMDLYLARKPG